MIEPNGTFGQEEAEKEWEGIISANAGIERRQMQLAFMELAETRERGSGYVRTKESLGMIYRGIQSGVVDKVYDCVDGRKVEVGTLDTEKALQGLKEMPDWASAKAFYASIQFLIKIAPLPLRPSGFKMTEVGVNLSNALENLSIPAK